MAKESLVITDKGDALIKKVELYSVGWLCEPDLTGSCHVFTVTYTNKEKVLFILDAWAFQKTSSAKRNAIFDTIFQTARAGCMLATHAHFDHMGRFVVIHKGLMAEHDMKSLPVLMSQATHDLLPAILKSYHKEKKDTVASFDEDVVKFSHSIEKFFRSYMRKPVKSDKTRKNHKPHGDEMRKKWEEKRARIRELEDEFEDGGGIIEKSDLLVPKDLSKPEKKFLHDIRRLVDKIKKDNGDKFDEEEGKNFQNVERALPILFLGEEVEEELKKIMLGTYIPRQKRRERENKKIEIEEFLWWKLDEKRRTLLPEVTEEDIGLLVRQSRGVPNSIPQPLTWVPWVTMTLHPTGHMLWAVSIELECKMVKGEIKRILVSGDIGSWEKPTIHGTPQLPGKKANVVIMETTNAGRIHPEMAESITKMIDFIRAKKGPIIMPVFAIDRMHIVLDTFREIILKGDFPCPIYWRNQLGANTLNTYLRHLSEIRDIFSKIIPLNGENNGGTIHRMAEWDEHCVLMISGWSLQSGSTAWNVFKTRAEAWKEIFLLMTWYQPAWLGQKIMEAVKAWNDPEEILEIPHDCEIISIKRGNVCLGDIFSWHGDKRDLTRFAEAGEERYLIHWNPKSSKEFAESIGWATIIKPNTTITLLGK